MFFKRCADGFGRDGQIGQPRLAARQQQFDLDVRARTGSSGNLPSIGSSQVRLALSNVKPAAPATRTASL